MRRSVLALCLLMAACAGPGGGPATVTALSAADAATALIAGDRIELSQRASPGGDGQEPLVVMTLRHSDGRSLSFEQGNQVQTDLIAQAPGGPLAQIMGYFGDETPTLYRARAQESRGAPFLCGPEGPVGIGLHEGADGVTQIVGLKQEVQFEELSGGGYEALPYSPDMVCARLKFRRG